MAVRNALPFEFPYRWNDVRRFFGKIEDEAVDYLDQRDRDLEDFLSASVVPLIFHWPRATADHVNVRNGPGEFRSDGRIYMIRYRWDTPGSSTSTVEWKFDGTTVMTHTLPATTNPHIEYPARAYGQEAIVSILTASGTGASGLTAFVYFGA